MNMIKELYEPAFENGYEIASQKGVAVVGMSPGNSYFKKETIDDLLNYCSGIFSQVKIMIADKPSEHTYLALGYSSKEAERKARLNSNTLQNHSRKSIDGIISQNVELIEWSNQINPNETYQRELAKINELYSSNPVFRQEARETTRSVLEGKLKQEVEIESAVDEGINYLLKELAFLSASPEIFKAERITYVYHDRWKIYEDFVDGKFDGRKRKDLGFVIVN
jgi:cyclo(L-tyrosyl-L-tyrosyl) synthase